MRAVDAYIRNMNEALLSEESLYGGTDNPYLTQLQKDSNTRVLMCVSAVYALHHHPMFFTLIFLFLL